VKTENVSVLIFVPSHLQTEDNSQEQFAQGLKLICLCASTHSPRHRCEHLFQLYY